jgi:prephenate dehydrogenase
MMLGVLQSNCDNILNSIHRLQDELQSIEANLVSEDFNSLELLLNSARAKYRELTTEN